MHFFKSMYGESGKMLIAIYKTFGKNPFFTRELRDKGISIPHNHIMSTLRKNGYLRSTGHDKTTATKWCLTDEAYTYIGTYISNQ